ncbi:Cytochrome oxidase Cu insertion factor, SCO1/SenC/PrrC family [Halorhabdus sp. SVX81]|uniref:SCO family protein n=1 Tax=Halorhabdus sp. SVX81 TaxID=2978283 RepID=UPI0023DC6B29|nr:SCO family protein [Halorhabdus sp. SVX81]WEL17788.1 Cytochrome oxidase Cu insertion factor, SCO1/SenC/PrrC family [Halorhabdus sp. SVX81]
MNRRQYLGAIGGGIAALSAGCSTAESDTTVTSERSIDASNTYLDTPDLRAEPSILPYPAYGQSLPDVTLSDPLAGDSVSIDSDGRDTLITFFYSHCQTVCPRLISALRNVQAKAIEDNRIDTTAFQAVTFDPERDDADRLGGYADRMNVALDENWRFLAPDSPEDAKDIVMDEFGVRFERTHPEEMDKYMFTHRSLILLVNADGYVERSYTDSTPSWQSIYDDLRTLRDREA